MGEVPGGDRGGGFPSGAAGRAWLITAGYAVVVAVGLLLLGGGRLVDADTFGGGCATVEAAVLGWHGLRRGWSAIRSPSSGLPSPSARPTLVVVTVLTAATAVCAAVGMV